MGIKNLSGKITFLRVHDVGTGWGPASDFLDVEVVFKVNAGNLSFAYGFQLRNDVNANARQAMFELLKDANSRNINVSFDYDERAGKKNHRAFRIMII